MKKYNINLKKITDNTKAIIKKIGAKNLVVFLAILAIGGAVYVNYMLFNDPLDTIGYGENNMEDTYNVSQCENLTDEQSVITDTYFSTTVLSRQKARDEALSVLQTVATSNNALEETKSRLLLIFLK